MVKPIRSCVTFKCFYTLANNTKMRSQECFVDTVPCYFPLICVPNKVSSYAMAILNHMRRHIDRSLDRSIDYEGYTSLVRSTRHWAFYVNYPKYEPHTFMKTLREMEKMLITSNISFSLNSFFFIVSINFSPFLQNIK